MNADEIDVNANLEQTINATLQSKWNATMETRSKKALFLSTIHNSNYDLDDNQPNDLQSIANGNAIASSPANGTHALETLQSPPKSISIKNHLAGPAAPDNQRQTNTINSLPYLSNGCHQSHGFDIIPPIKTQCETNCEYSRLPTC